ncbi:hypothetical protein Phum_PHUM470920 [Pediculus humanus corporis]|uniref:Uncharacterized protein n=1 Tax=Pediculus humanus subsp. corporis TaxID=121224 RepID=E0VVY1_PEDHC|nr:uncharacterized protein Phum_PHUM470920 [Pediculus humanus corporis]EEB17537.1 hypothetical protein Phum_PHUM470920 [Pediculus humanus corporis]
MYKPETIGVVTTETNVVDVSNNTGNQSGKDQIQERESLHLDAAVGKLLEGKE